MVQSRLWSRSSKFRKLNSFLRQNEFLFIQIYVGSRLKISTEMGLYMKLVLAIVNNDDSAMVSSALTNEGYFITKLSTTGGFLMVGNTTLLIGADDDKVEHIKAIISKYSSTRSQAVTTNASFGSGISLGEPSVNVSISGATIFVLNVDSFEKL
jgi:uncharacterized protein YaaQ